MYIMLSSFPKVGKTFLYGPVFVHDDISQVSIER